MDGLTSPYMGLCRLYRASLARRARTAARDVEQYSQTSGMEAMKYAVVIERAAESYGAYVPDLPGCVAVAKTFEEVERLIREAVEIRSAGLREHGAPLPESATVCEYADTALSAQKDQSRVRNQKANRKTSTAELKECKELLAVDSF